MKKIIGLVIIAILLTGCSNEDDVDCSLFDPITPSLFVKFIDTSGENLIENGSIDPEEIEILEGGDFRFNPPNEYAYPGSSLGEFDNTIQLFIRDETSEYVIKLTENQTIRLDFTAEYRELQCNISFYDPTGVAYNGETVELEEIFDLSYLVEVEIQ